MTTDQIKGIIDEFNKLGVNSVSFTGGEPTLRKDLSELVDYAGTNYSFYTGFATNGYLLPKLFKEHRFEGLDYILVSLDFPNAKKHDNYRGINCFNNAVKGIKIAEKRGIKVIISTVVMKDNIDLMEDMVSFANNLNCTIEILPVENIVRYIDGVPHKIEKIDDFIPNIRAWGDKVLELRKKYNNMVTDLYTVLIIEEGGFGGVPKHQDYLRCHVAGAYVFVRQDGKIDFPCKLHPVKSFDALKIPLSKIFRSKEAREIMQMHDNYDFCDGCRLGCAIATSIPTSLNLLYEKYISAFFKGNLR
jgi:MoaA/NifB/PqqE/SkfB family radical SAM enzyme